MTMCGWHARKDVPLFAAAIYVQPRKGVNGPHPASIGSQHRREFREVPPRCVPNSILHPLVVRPPGRWGGLLDPPEDGLVCTPTDSVSKQCTYHEPDVTNCRLVESFTR